MGMPSQKFGPALHRHQSSTVAPACPFGTRPSNTSSTGAVNHQYGRSRKERIRRMGGKGGVVPSCVSSRSVLPARWTARVKVSGMNPYLFTCLKGAARLSFTVWGHCIPSCWAVPASTRVGETTVVSHCYTRALRQCLRIVAAKRTYTPVNYGTQAHVKDKLYTSSTCKPKFEGHANSSQDRRSSVVLYPHKA